MLKPPAGFSVIKFHGSIDLGCPPLWLLTYSCKSLWYYVRVISPKLFYFRTNYKNKVGLPIETLVLSAIFSQIKGIATLIINYSKKDRKKESFTQQSKKTKKSFIER